MTSRQTKAMRKASQLGNEAAAKPFRLTPAEIDALRQDKKDALAWLAKAQGRKVRTTDDLLNLAETSSKKRKSAAGSKL
jgi:hypothetical protein